MNELNNEFSEHDLHIYNMYKCLASFSTSYCAQLEAINATYVQATLAVATCSVRGNTSCNPVCFMAANLTQLIRNHHRYTQGFTLSEGGIQLLQWKDQTMTMKYGCGFYWILWGGGWVVWGWNWRVKGRTSPPQHLRWNRENRPSLRTESIPSWENLFCFFT